MRAPYFLDLYRGPRMGHMRHMSHSMPSWMTAAEAERSSAVSPSSTMSPCEPERGMGSGRCVTRLEAGEGDIQGEADAAVATLESGSLTNWLSGRSLAEKQL